LPVVIGAGQPLVFRNWAPGLILQEGPFATRHPYPDQREVIPGLLLVPLLAFDDKGMRLGWGGGFYDRTLAVLRGAGSVVAVGVAYDDQMVERVPHASNDEPLDWIVTDKQCLEAG